MGPDDRGARDRVLTAAVELFAQNGYAATSVREIVARAGVTKPVLYYYFGSKDGLFRTIADMAREHQIVVLENAVARTGALFDNILGLFNDVLRSVKENRSVVRIFHGLVFGPDREAPSVDITGFRNRTMDAIRIVCEKGRDRGELAAVDLDGAVHLIHSVIHHLIMDQIAEIQDYSQDLPGRMLRLAFDGLSIQKVVS
jgi:AcrR family transcriptional regulator